MARRFGTNKVVLIMASHSGRRWKGKPPKHLIRIAGEKLILRTIRQLRKRGAFPIVVTHLPYIQEIVPKFFVPEERRWYAETLLSTRELWRDKVVVLQGDVVYTNAVMNEILNGAYQLCLYRFSATKEGIHGLVFHGKHSESVATALGTIVTNAERDPQHNMGDQGFLSRHLNEQMPGSVYEVILPRDYTRDFDHRKDYKAFLAKNPWARGRDEDITGGQSVEVISSDYQ